MENGVALLDWRSKSLNLSPIENLWVDIVLDVNRNVKQYDNTDDLQIAIQKAWKSVTEEPCKGLVHSKKKRCIEVIEMKGRKTHY